MRAHLELGAQVLHTVLQLLDLSSSVLAGRLSRITGLSSQGCGVAIPHVVAHLHTAQAVNHDTAMVLSPNELSIGMAGLIALVAVLPDQGADQAGAYCQLSSGNGGASLSSKSVAQVQDSMKTASTR